MSLEAMKQALEALTINSDRVTEIGKQREAITSLRKAIQEEALRNVQRLGQEIEQEQVSYLGNGTAGRENTIAPTGFLLSNAKPEQEPVAWRFKTGTWWNREVHWRYVLSLDGTEGLLGLEPLYTHPPQRKENT